MTSLRDIIRQIQRQPTEEERLKPMSCNLAAIDYSNSARVKNRTNYVWVREYNNPNNAFIAYAPNIQDRPGLPVLVGKNSQPPNFRRIVTGIDYNRTDDETDLGDGHYEGHGPTHEWPDGAPGPDPVNIYPRAIRPLALRVVGGMSLYVTPGIYRYRGHSIMFGGKQINMLPYIPGAGLAVRVCVYINPLTNTIAHHSSPTVPSTIAPAFEFPDVLSLPIGWVKLLNTTTDINETLISDPRAFLSVDAGSDTNIIRYTYTGAIDAVYSADEDGLVDALAGAVSGDNIVLPIETEYTTNITIPDGVKLSSYHWGRASITGIVTCSGAVKITNIDIAYTAPTGASPSADVYVVRGEGSGLIELNQCVISVGAEAGVTCYALGLLNDTTDAQLWRCYIHGLYGEGTENAFYISNGLYQEITWLYSTVYNIDNISNNYTSLKSYGNEGPEDFNYGVALYGDRAKENHTHAEMGWIDDIETDMTGISDGEVPIYSSALDKFLPGAGGGGGSGTAEIHFFVDGTLAVSTNSGGVYVIPKATQIESIYMTCKDPGSAGSTIVDVNYNGTTLFTTQANRPTLAYDDANGWVSAVPDITGLVEGDVISFDIDQIATNAAGLAIVIVSTAYDGTNTFIALADTPANYTGQALKSTRVKASEDGIEFYTPSSEANLVKITFAESTTTQGQDTDGRVSGSYATHGCIVYIHLPIKLTQILWDIKKASTYTLRIKTYYGGSTLHTFANVVVASDNTADVVFTPPTVPLLLMPGRYYFELTPTASVTWNDNNNNSPLSFGYITVEDAYYDTSIANAYSPAVKFEFYLGTFSLVTI